MKIKIFCMVVLLTTLVSCKKQQDLSENHTHADGTSHNHSDTPDYFGSYKLVDKEFGTETEVVVSESTRTITTNALPNHITGTFPNPGNPNTIKAQKKTYTLPVNPEYTGDAEWVREFGVALNGIKFEPGTGERVFCESGESFRIEAKQDHFDLGLDVNNAHVQPTGEYHYHGTPTGIVSQIDTDQDLVHVGFANDGFPVYFSRTDAYKPSFKLVDLSREGTDCAYTQPHKSESVEIDGEQPDGTYASDWEYVEGLGALDACNGITIDNKYIYLITAEYPYVGRCLNGKFDRREMGGPPPGGGRGPRPGGPQEGRPREGNHRPPPERERQGK